MFHKLDINKVKSNDILKSQVPVFMTTCRRGGIAVLTERKFIKFSYSKYPEPELKYSWLDIQKYQINDNKKKAIFWFNQAKKSTCKVEFHDFMEFKEKIYTIWLQLLDIEVLQKLSKNDQNLEAFLGSRQDLFIEKTPFAIYSRIQEKLDKDGIELDRSSSNLIKDILSTKLKVFDFNKFEVKADCQTFLENIDIFLPDFRFVNTLILPPIKNLFQYLAKFYAKNIYVSMIVFDRVDEMILQDFGTFINYLKSFETTGIKSTSPIKTISFRNSQSISKDLLAKLNNKIITGYEFSNIFHKGILEFSELGLITGGDNIKMLSFDNTPNLKVSCVLNNLPRSLIILSMKNCKIDISDVFVQINTKKLINLKEIYLCNNQCRKSIKFKNRNLNEGINKILTFPIRNIDTISVDDVEWSKGTLISFFGMISDQVKMSNKLMKLSICRIKPAQENQANDITNEFIQLFSFIENHFKHLKFQKLIWNDNVVLAPPLIKLLMQNIDTLEILSVDACISNKMKKTDDTDIVYRFFRDFCKFIVKSNSLKELSISGNNKNFLGSKLFIQIIDSFIKRFERNKYAYFDFVDISKTQCGDEGIKFLYDNMIEGKLSNLKKIDIDGSNPINYYQYKKLTSESISTMFKYPERDIESISRSAEENGINPMTKSDKNSLKKSFCGTLPMIFKAYKDKPAEKNWFWKDKFCHYVVSDDEIGSKNETDELNENIYRHHKHQHMHGRRYEAGNEEEIKPSKRKNQNYPQVSKKMKIKIKELNQYQKLISVNDDFEPG